jgi:prepilin peptidase CpaA
VIAVAYGAMLTVTLIASVTDFRSGLIPNWLTFPALLLGPCLGAASDGWQGAGSALLGIVIAGSIPVLFHSLRAMGAGDVKLFAALGGLGGVRFGLEIELYAMSCACGWGIVMLTYRGSLLASLQTSVRLFANVFLPAEQQRSVATAELTQLRIGSAIFAGTLLAVARRVF